MTVCPHAASTRGRTFVSEGSIKVVVAEDHPIARHGIVQLLEGTEEFVVVGEAPSGEAALDLAEGITSGPTIFLVDLRLPGIDGLETTRRLASVCPDAGVVILTAFEDTRSMVEAVRAGAKAYVVKSARRDEILDTVRMVAHGHVVFASGVWDALAHQGTAPDAGTARLTRRESQVLTLLSRGLTNREIADELGLSAETVKTHLERLYKRLGVNARTDAVAKAFRSGLLE